MKNDTILVFHERAMTTRLTAGMATLLLLFAGCITKQPNEVVILSALDREFSEEILNDISAELKIPLRKKFDVESNKTVGLANEIIASASRPRADLFWNNEILHTIRLEKLGLLQRYRSPEAGRFPLEFLSQEGYWYGFAARCRVLIVNTDLMPDPQQRPQSVMDLIDPRFEKQCTLARPLFGTSATHAAVLFNQLGVEESESFFEALATHCVVQGGNKQVAEKVAAGEFLFGLTDTDDAIVEIEKGRPVAIVFPDQGADERGALLIPNTISLIKNGPNPTAAKQVLDRLLAADIEARLAAGGSAQIPLADDVEGKPRLKGLETLKTMVVDFEAAAESWPQVAEKLAEIFPVGGR